MTQKEINSKVPSWAFEKGCVKDFSKYLKAWKKEPGKEDWPVTRL